MWPIGKNKKKQTKKRKKERMKYHQSDKEHNFDDELSDIEFFEVVDDE